MNLLLRTSGLGLILASLAIATNFPYEKVVLTEEDIGDFPAIAFGDASNGSYTGPRCRVQPGDPSWPSDDEWARFNSSLEGKLLKPVPPAAACYPGHYYDEAQCEFLLGPAGKTRFYLDDPLTVLTQWPEGSTCLAGLNVTGECTSGGFPLYVVNASSVKDIQLAVNFARNKNIRLNIKNTGHDFAGRSTGHASLSVWVHHLKNFEFVRDYSIGDFHGSAARIGAGLETWELSNAMNETGDILVVLSGDGTLGIAGGWSQGGGHSILSSLYGLGADQYLSFDLVTADGRFITANANQNRDIFFAVRGGGPSTYGILTSAIFRGYSGPFYSSGLSYSFSTGPEDAGNLSTVGGTASSPTVVIPDRELFWEGYKIYLNFTKQSSAVGGFGFGDLDSLGNDTFSFTSSFTMPGMTDKEATAFLAPLFASFRGAGINITDPPASTHPYAQPSDGIGDAPGSSIFSSRLFPSANWDDGGQGFDNMTAAIRRTVEGGYLFRGRNYSPSGAGTVSSGAAINPAFRNSLMHATVFLHDAITAETTPADWLRLHGRLDGFMHGLREATPGGGAYLNEADVLEPQWQESFFGHLYPRLAMIKKNVDPWGLFWVPTTPGSEAWEVVTRDGLPTQNGPLCRTGK